MIFSLDVRRARKGDCLLLHFGSKQPGLIMIDGGPKSVYGPFLKPRIDEIRTARKVPPNKPLDVDLLMVSHVDDDHIQGILDLTQQLITASMESRPQLLQVSSFWHNSFDEIIGHEPKELSASMTTHFGPASVGGSGDLPDEAREEVEQRYVANNVDADPDDARELVSSALKVLASIEQGFRLRLNADALHDRGLGFDRNPEFDGKLIMAREAGEPIEIAQGLEFTVLGPMQPELKELFNRHQDWLEELKKKGKSPPEALAAYVDKSVPNLSSIVVLAELCGKRILLTGDARGDKILEGLQLSRRLDPGKDSKIKVDILKVPHHGSDNNLDRDFFERIIADHYIFSGDGEHGNPERKTMEMLFDARSKEEFTIHLTYPVEEIDAGRKEDWQKEQNKEKARRAKNPNAEVRPDWSPKENSLAVFFETRGLAKGQRIEIVDAKKAHVIDLLDPLGF